MAAIANLVHETTTSTTTGNLTLAAVNGKQRVSTAFGTGDDGDDNPVFFISNREAAEFEIVQTYMSDANTLVRPGTLIGSSTGSAINFSAGTKDVTNDVPAEHTVYSALATLASAATTELGSKIAPYIIVTGTTGITAFGWTAPKGAKKRVKFSGALTLTHNATSLILPGAADVTTAAGDSLEAVYEGSGNWRVTQYTVVSFAPGGVVASSQAEMEAAASLNTYGSPGRQHFHPGHPKTHGVATVSAGTPTLQVSFNLAGVSDTAQGRITFTIADDFSSSNWTCSAAVELVDTIPDNSSDNREIVIEIAAAGSVILHCRDEDAAANGGAGTAVDPASWHMIGLGDRP